MKNLNNKIAKTIFVFTLMTFGITGTILVGAPQPPSQHGNTTNQPVSQGAAPIGTATLLMLGLGGAYIGGRIYYNRKKEK
ncbi:MAG: hypothetical protein LBL77_02160 [Endomicrobium sp.]|jgi:hypothetical protein|nr:hypothetical protein [Endomicrobium sp.]